MNIEQLKKYHIFKDEEILSLELLKNQGFNNISYLLKTSQNVYVIRVFKSNDSVNISRIFEFEIQKKAYKKNIATKPIFFNENFMIYEYKKGIHKKNLSSFDIKNLALKIKKLHKIKAKTKAYDIKKDLQYYKKNLKDKKNQKLITQCFKSLNKLKKHKEELVLTHHDLNPKNIIFHNNSIKIIDWEYTGLNDKFFDLASICVEFKFNKIKEKLFLEKYLLNYSKKDITKLNHYKIIYKNICNLWFETINNL